MDYYKEIREKIRSAGALIKDELITGNERSKTYYYRNTHERTYNVGDRVLLKREIIKIGRPKKLEPLYEGPYTIVSKLNDLNYKIRMKAKNVVVHVNRLKPYRE